VKLSVDAPKILDWDLENRPLTYLGNDFTTAEITGIAASWIPTRGWRAPSPERVYCYLLGELTTETMLGAFRVLYEQADVLTGHYIRAHDLPILNGAMIEFGFPPLSPKLTIDTKIDLLRFKDISKSQESLAGMLGIDAPKITMTQTDWRMANRLEPEGLKRTRERVTGDVIQHKQMYAELVKRGLLGPPKLWTPQP
jgi:hypothetical protein